MAFDAGAAVGRMTLDGTSWISSSKKIINVNQTLNKSLKTISVLTTAVFTASIAKTNEFNKAFANSGS